MTRLAAHALVALSMSGSVSAGDNWPQFRGPRAAGVGDGDPPTRWDVTTGKNVRWATEIPGLAHSAPIVWEDRVYLTTAVMAGGDAPTLETGWIGGSGDSPVEDAAWTWRVLALDAGSGEIIWNRPLHMGVPRAARHLKATHANATPATDGRRVVAFFGSEGLYCLTRDGELLWKADLGLLDCGPYNAPQLEWGFASSPIIHDGQVIVQCDAKDDAKFWASFDLETGRELRRVRRADVSTWATPNVYEHDGRTVLACNGWKEMAGYDLATGERLWTLSGGGDVPVPTPLVADGRVYLTNGHGRNPLYAIEQGARGTLTPGDDALPAGLAWWQPRGGSYMPTPLILDGRLYVGTDNGVLLVFDAASGAEVYKERLASGVTYSASPVAAGGHVYFTSEPGEVQVIRAGPVFELVARNDMGAVCMATPAIADGALFVRTTAKLYCLALAP